MYTYDYTFSNFIYSRERIIIVSAFDKLDIVFILFT